MAFTPFMLLQDCPKIMNFDTKLLEICAFLDWRWLQNGACSAPKIARSLKLAESRLHNSLHFILLQFSRHPHHPQCLRCCMLMAAVCLESTKSLLDILFGDILNLCAAVQFYDGSNRKAVPCLNVAKNGHRRSGVMAGTRVGLHAYFRTGLIQEYFVRLSWNRRGHMKHSHSHCASNCF